MAERQNKPTTMPWFSLKKLCNMITHARPRHFGKLFDLVFIQNHNLMQCNLSSEKTSCYICHYACQLIRIPYKSFYWHILFNYPHIKPGCFFSTPNIPNNPRFFFWKKIPPGAVRPCCTRCVNFRDRKTYQRRWFVDIGGKTPRPVNKGGGES